MSISMPMDLRLGIWPAQARATVDTLAFTIVIGLIGLVFVTYFELRNYFHWQSGSVLRQMSR